MTLTPSDRQRRLAAKRSNERVKLATNFINALGLGVIGAALIVPGISDPSTARWTWFRVGAGLHLIAQLLLQLLRSED